MKKNKTICLVSSSGGHFEQLKQLRPLLKMYSGFVVTEDTGYDAGANYYLISTGSNDKLVIFKMVKMMFQTLKIWIKEKPDIVITTGTLISLPFAILCKFTRKKFVYIETFARVKDGTRTGKLMYHFADLFIIQWPELKKIYPKAIYGGSIY